MTEEKRDIIITIHGVTVDKRTNGDGFAYSHILENLRRMAEIMIETTSETLIPDFWKVTIEDKVSE